MRILAAIALLLPAICVADEPQRAAMVDAPPHAIAAANKRAKKEADLDLAKQLAADPAWLKEVASATASQTRPQDRKLPPGMAVTVAKRPGSNDDFPFGIPVDPKQPGPTMKQIRRETSYGERWSAVAVLWADERRYNVEQLKSQPPPE